MFQLRSCQFRLGSRNVAIRREPDDSEVQRWATLRAEAEARYREAIERLIQEGPDDELGQVAWRAGMSVERLPYDELLRQAVNTARTGRWSWREIAGAGGSPTDRPSVDRFTAKQAWRQRRRQQLGDEIGQAIPGFVN